MHLYVYYKKTCLALLIDQVTSVDKHAIWNKWLACAGGEFERGRGALGGVRGRRVAARALVARHTRNPRVARTPCIARDAYVTRAAYVTRDARAASRAARYHHAHTHHKGQGFQVIIAFSYLNSTLEKSIFFENACIVC